MEGSVGFVTENFLQKRKAEDLAVVHVGSGSATRDDLAVITSDASVAERVIDGGIESNDKVFEGEG